jgi:hypothetical protein
MVRRHTTAKTIRLNILRISVGSLVGLSEYGLSKPRQTAGLEPWRVKHWYIVLSGFAMGRTGRSRRQPSVKRACFQPTGCWAAAASQWNGGSTPVLSFLLFVEHW